jgi:glycerol-3-phosphate acyltransferase PlsY
MAYLIGSFPSAYIISRWLKQENIRRLGDRNKGVGNAFRELSPWAGISVFVIDALKEMIVVALTNAVSISQGDVLSCGMLAIIGHNWPIFLSFRGGRGVSTTIGVSLAILS